MKKKDFEEDIKEDKVQKMSLGKSNSDICVLHVYMSD